MTDEAVQHGPIEIRATGSVTGVSFPERTIDLIVIPYEEPTRVEYHGRMIREVVAPGAFNGIERRAKRVRVNYFHQDKELRHLLGRATAFQPSREEGLVATVRIRPGEYGDAALDLADDGDLGASAGFGVMPGGETWPNRDTRRLTRLFLDHVALTPTPAYEGAQVLAVRSEQPAAGERPATPILDRIENTRWEDELAAIDARWLR